MKKSCVLNRFYVLNMPTGLIGGVLYAFEGRGGIWRIQDEFMGC
jgi:hypothetical protein